MDRMVDVHMTPTDVHSPRHSRHSEPVEDTYGVLERAVDHDVAYVAEVDFKQLHRLPAVGSRFVGAAVV